MPTLYRVFPHLAAAAADQVGGALYVPPQGSGRLDNPRTYAVLYLSGSAAGAVAEAFGRFPEWNAAILESGPSLPGSVRSLARFRLPDDAPVCNLDDASMLAELGLRPSDVVTRDYTRSRAWAREIHARGKWIGVRWWSYYDPQWASLGLWNLGRLRLEEVSPLRLGDAAIQEAARTIVRQVIVARPKRSR